MAIVDAVESRAGTDPDRASFTTALEAARDQLIAASGICPADPSGLTSIGRAVLHTLLPTRRPRFSARKVKCATSRYLNHGDERPHVVTVIAGISVTVRTGRCATQPACGVLTAGRPPAPNHPPAASGSPPS